MCVETKDQDQYPTPSESQVELGSSEPQLEFRWLNVEGVTSLVRNE